MPRARLENRPHDVTRAVRLPRDVDRRPDRLIEAHGSNRNREIKSRPGLRRFSPTGLKGSFLLIRGSSDPAAPPSSQQDLNLSQKRASYPYPQAKKKRGPSQGNLFWFLPYLQGHSTWDGVLQAIYQQGLNAAANPVATDRCNRCVSLCFKPIRLRNSKS